MFKIKSIAACVALATVATGAQAITLGTDPVEETIVITGATAQDETLEALFTLDSPSRVCVSGTLEIYRYADANGAPGRVFFCQMDNTTVGIGTATNVAVIKSSTGSGDGVGPVHGIGPDFAGEAFDEGIADLTQLDPSDCTSSVNVPADPANNVAAYVDHSGCTVVADSVVPDAGVSDVEPILLGASSAAAAALNANSANAVVWGVPVSVPFYEALQQAQLSEINALATAKGQTADCTVGDIREQCMPSLSRIQVASIYAGQLTDWRFFLRESDGLRLDQITGGAPALNGGTGSFDIYLCRRDEGSGTQASFETDWLRQRCSAGVRDMAPGNDGCSVPPATPSVNKGADGVACIPGDGSLPGGTVFAGDGTGDVRECLSRHGYFGRFAVGLFSTENVPSDVAAGSPVTFASGPDASAFSEVSSDGLPDEWYRYVKVDGIAPTLEAAANHEWQFLAEQSLQWRQSPSTNPLNGDKLSIMDKVVQRVGQPTAIANLNVDARDQFGSLSDGGVMALGANVGVDAPTFGAGGPYTAAQVRATPVVSQTKAIGGTNNCEESLIFQAGGTFTRMGLLK